MISPIQLLDTADEVRREIAAATPQKRKAQLGQFMTSAPVARFMADMFEAGKGESCTLLDAGAGVGALSCAFLDRWAARGFPFRRVRLEAYEIDPELQRHLSFTLARYVKAVALDLKVIGGDFIEHIADEGELGRRRFTHAILNPPYKKIHSTSEHRRSLRMLGIETVNLYSAFVALGLRALDPGGQLVAIIPRSFCNGPYYRPFRDFLLANSAIRHVHLFSSRSEAFKDDDVLQENVIIRLERGGTQGPVRISTSTDASFRDLQIHEHPFAEIVLPGDSAHFIHIPTSPTVSRTMLPLKVPHSLSDLGLAVSTGPVVDFRLRAHLRDQPENGTVPLLYPGHFFHGETVWPKPDLRKPNAIHVNTETERWLFPNGFYCVVRRFSSKEERRRVVASVINPSAFPTATLLGFENHLNVFHRDRQGLPEPIARGLAMFLNTKAVDEQFRRFSGHTQVNAADLKLMKYPDLRTLAALGTWSIKHPTADESEKDLEVMKGLSRK